MILGNDLAGSKVWADGNLNTFKQNAAPPVPPEVFPVCAIARSASRKEIESKPESLELSVTLQTEQLTSSRD